MADLSFSNSSKLELGRPVHDRLVATIQVALEAANFMSGPRENPCWKTNSEINRQGEAPNGLVLAVHVRHDPSADPPAFAEVAVELFAQSQYPDAFPERLPVEEAFLQALAYAERVWIPVV